MAERALSRIPTESARDTGGPSPAPHLLARATAEREAEASVDTWAPQLGPAPRGLRDDRGLAGFGRPLPPLLRAAEEARLGADLSAVRLHDDAAAQHALREASARALTRGAGIAMSPEDALADTPERAGLMRHELAHATQQAVPGAAPMTQREGGPDEGIGRTPPDVPFTTLDTRGAEDEHTLFDHDSATPTPTVRGALDAMAQGREGELVVHIHGYASLEGADDYNRNLSAHRAVAARAALAPLLPGGTRFVLYAHGETDVFGNPAQNRRVGVDFIQPGDGSYLGAPGPLSLFPRRRLRLRHFEPSELDLGAPRPTLEAPTVPNPRDLTRDDLGLPPDRDGLEPDPDGRQRPPPPPQPHLAAPPPLFTQPYDFGATARDFALRGVPLTEGYAADINGHYEYWRLRFFRMGLSPDLAELAAQTGTDMMVGTHLSLQAPTQFEQFDRRFGTEPTTFTILNESRMRWIFDQVRRRIGGDQ